MGVAGSGKTTVGRALADALRWRFEDADDYHSETAIEAMAAGIALTDADRHPWLRQLAELIDRRMTVGPPTVLACSALKAAYRQRLRGGHAGVRFVWLDVPESELARRLAQRRGHPVGPSLLASQVDTFEPPAGAVRIDGTGRVPDLVQAIRQRVGT